MAPELSRGASLHTGFPGAIALGRASLAGTRLERVRSLRGCPTRQDRLRQRFGPAQPVAPLKHALPVQAKLRTSSRRASNSSFGGSPRCSQMTRTMGSVWLTRTWNQRPGQSTRSPSSTLTRPSL